MVRHQGLWSLGERPSSVWGCTARLNRHGWTAAVLGRTLSTNTFSQAHSWTRSIRFLSFAAYSDWSLGWCSGASGVPNSKSIGRSIDRPNMSSQGEKSVASCIAKRFAIINTAKYSSVRVLLVLSHELGQQGIHSLVEPLDHSIRLREQRSCPGFIHALAICTFPGTRGIQSSYLAQSVSAMVHQSGWQTFPLQLWPLYM